MNLTDKSSKLVATIGPSSDNYNTMRSLIEAGATCIRVNFSHGSHEEHLNKFKIAKKISEDMHLQFVFLFLFIFLLNFYQI